MPDTIAQLQKKMQELSAAGRKYVEDEDLQQRVSDLQARAEQLIREYPIGVVAGALVLGFIIGKLVSGDDD